MHKPLGFFSVTPVLTQSGLMHLRANLTQMKMHMSISVLGKTIFCASASEDLKVVT